MIHSRSFFFNVCVFFLLSTFFGNICGKLKRGGNLLRFREYPSQSAVCNGELEIETFIVPDACNNAHQAPNVMFVKERGVWKRNVYSEEKCRNLTESLDIELNQCVTEDTNDQVWDEMKSFSGKVPVGKTWLVLYTEENCHTDKAYVIMEGKAENECNTDDDKDKLNECKEYPPIPNVYANGYCTGQNIFGFDYAKLIIVLSIIFFFGFLGLMCCIVGSATVWCSILGWYQKKKKKGKEKFSKLDDEEEVEEEEMAEIVEEGRIEDVEENIESGEMREDEVENKDDDDDENQNVTIKRKDEV